MLIRNVGFFHTIKANLVFLLLVTENRFFYIIITTQNPDFIKNI